jgi:hypothetical protein
MGAFANEKKTMAKRNHRFFERSEKIVGGSPGSPDAVRIARHFLNMKIPPLGCLAWIEQIVDGRNSTDFAST